MGIARARKRPRAVSGPENSRSVPSTSQTTMGSTSQSSVGQVDDDDGWGVSTQGTRGPMLASQNSECSFAGRAVRSLVPKAEIWMSNVYVRLGDVVDDAAERAVKPFVMKKGTTLTSLSHPVLVDMASVGCTLDGSSLFG